MVSHFLFIQGYCLRLAGTHNGVDLQILDNQYSADVGLENATRFVAENVDLVIEFQIDDRDAPRIGYTITSAGIAWIVPGCCGRCGS